MGLCDCTLDRQPYGGDASIILTELSDIVYSSVVQLRAAAVRLKQACKLVGSLHFSVDSCAVWRMGWKGLELDVGKLIGPF